MDHEGAIPPGGSNSQERSFRGAGIISHVCPKVFGVSTPAFAGELSSKHLIENAAVNFCLEDRFRPIMSWVPPLRCYSARFPPINFMLTQLRSMTGSPRVLVISQGTCDAGAGKKHFDFIADMCKEHLGHGGQVQGQLWLGQGLGFRAPGA